MTYTEWKAAMRAHEQDRPAEHLTGILVFTQDSFDRVFPRLSRAYLVGSNNKAFQPNMGGYSIFASCLDGTDPCVRLERLMAAETGRAGDWKIEDCFILEQLRDHQERHRQAELDSRQCLSGPHKDDLLVELDGRSAKTYGSQGQTRTAALSLKLAQRDIFFQETGEYPVLLLDDVLSELDARRQAFVLNHIQGGQIFITCCEEEKLEGLEGGAAFHIHGGALV